MEGVSTTLVIVVTAFVVLEVVLAFGLLSVIDRIKDHLRRKLEV